MRVLFLVNANAGGKAVRSAAQSALNRFTSVGWKVDYVISDSLEYSEELIRGAEGNGFELLVIGGGDGTIHHAVQHLPLGSSQEAKGIPLGIIPLGSGNDFFRGTGAPLDPEGAAENIIHGSPLPVDVGLVEPLHEDGSPRKERALRFINTAGIGIDSYTLATRERSPGWLSARYEVLFLATLIWMRPIEVTLVAESWQTSQRAYWVLCCNNGFIGTGMKIAPSARIDDGLIDVVVVDDVPKWRFVKNLPKVFKGTHIHEKGLSIRSARSVTVRSDPVIRFAIDGDLSLIHI